MVYDFKQVIESYEITKRFRGKSSHMGIEDLDNGWLNSTEKLNPAMQGSQVWNREYENAIGLENPMNFGQWKVDLFKVLKDLICNNYVKKRILIREYISLQITFSNFYAVAPCLLDLVITEFESI